MIGHKQLSLLIMGVPVMIAQWENECISLSVLSSARVMIAQWENECITVCPPCDPGSISDRGWRGISKGFSLADHISSTRPEPARQNMVQSPLNGTQNLW